MVELIIRGDEKDGEEGIPMDVIETVMKRFVCHRNDNQPHQDLQVGTKGAKTYKRRTCAWKDERTNERCDANESVDVVDVHGNGVDRHHGSCAAKERGRDGGERKDGVWDPDGCRVGKH